MSPPLTRTAVPAKTQRFRDEYRAALPAGYNGWRQQRRITAAMLGVCALLLAGIEAFHWSLVATAVATWALSTVSEYLAHRIPMHRPVPRLEFMFRQHVRVHHRYFTDQAIEGADPLDVHATVLHPKQLVVLVFGVALPISLAIWGLLGGDAARVFAATVLVYMSFFEWVHLACHLPADHPAMAIPGLRWAREHHRLHHKPALMTRYNFQISVPAVDWIPGTGILQEGEVLRPAAGKARSTAQASEPHEDRQAS
ncbi:MAG: sterol desaturase family protein [Myxococcota bacterium]|nr:sterol desaturase family protein [Myxococcota bacterium]